MEWLSAEEKTRSMMPYLLDLPPLDRPDDAKKVTITEITDATEENDARTKKDVKEFDSEKWHMDTKNETIPVKHIYHKNDNDTEKSILYDFTVTKIQKYIDLSEEDMQILRELSKRHQK